MFKALALAVIGLIASATASHLEIPMQNWLQASPKTSPIKMQLIGASQMKLGSSATAVKWSEC